MIKAVLLNMLDHLVQIIYDFDAQDQRHPLLIEILWGGRRDGGAVTVLL